MLAADVIAFVRAALPAPPARVLEVGAGDGELSVALAAAGYDVVAIDPASEAENVRPRRLARARRAGRELRRRVRGRLAAPRRAAGGVVRPARGARAARRRAHDRRGRLPARRRARRSLVARAAAPTPTDVETVLGVRAHMHLRGTPAGGARAVVRARRAGPRRRTSTAGTCRDVRAGEERLIAGGGLPATPEARRDQKTLSGRWRFTRPTCTTTRYLPRVRGRSRPCSCRCGPSAGGCALAPSGAGGCSVSLTASAGSPCRAP